MELIFSKVQKDYEWNFLEIVRPLTYGLARIRDKLRRQVDDGSGKRGRYDLVCEQYEKRFPLRTIHAHNLAERSAI